MELETEKLNSDSHVLHTKKRDFYQKIIPHSQGNITTNENCKNEIFLLIKRTSRNIWTIFLVLLLLPIILLSTLDKYLDDVSSSLKLSA